MSARVVLCIASVFVGCATAEAPLGEGEFTDILFDAGRGPASPTDAGIKEPLDSGVGINDASPSADAQSVPDAMPAPDASPGCVDQQQQLLGNPDFELGGGSPWVETSAIGLEIVTSDFGDPQSGTHVGWLAGYNNANDTLYQDVTISPGADDLSISGYIAIGSEEIFGEWDFAVLELRSSTGVLLETLATWSNLDAGGTWQPFSVMPIGDYQGQTVRLHFRAQTDGSLMTNFVVDTLAVRETVCL